MSETVSKTVTMQNTRGLHARASAKLVNCAEQFDAEVTVTHGEMTVGGDSIMGLLMLGASVGKTVTITATGSDAQAAIDCITALVNDKFGEAS